MGVLQGDLDRAGSARREVSIIGAGAVQSLAGALLLFVTLSPEFAGDNEPGSNTDDVYK